MKTKSNPEEMGSGRKKEKSLKGAGREEMRELSVKAYKAYNIDLLPLLPINYPQKLLEPDTRKTGMGGQRGRGRRVAVAG